MGSIIVRTKNYELATSSFQALKEVIILMQVTSMDTGTEMLILQLKVLLTKL